LAKPNFFDKNNKFRKCVLLRSSVGVMPIYFLFLPPKVMFMKFPFLYFDPGTGALVVQVLAAAGAGIALFYKKIANGFRSVFGKKQQDQDLMGDIDIEDHPDDTKQ